MSANSDLLLSGVIKAIKDLGSSLSGGSNFKTNDVETIGTITYIGKSEPNNGKWIIISMDESVADLIVNRYATFNNNSGYNNYADAWTDKETLTYDRIEDIVI